MNRWKDCPQMKGVRPKECPQNTGFAVQPKLNMGEKKLHYGHCVATSIYGDLEIAMLIDERCVTLY